MAALYKQYLFFIVGFNPVPRRRHDAFFGFKIGIQTCFKWQILQRNSVPVIRWSSACSCSLCLDCLFPLSPGAALTIGSFLFLTFAYSDSLDILYKKWKKLITKARKFMWSHIFSEIFFLSNRAETLVLNVSSMAEAKSVEFFFHINTYITLKMGFLKNKHINPLFRGFRKNFGQNSTLKKKISTTLPNFWVPKSTLTLKKTQLSGLASTKFNFSFQN